MLITAVDNTKEIQIDAGWCILKHLWKLVARFNIINVGCRYCKKNAVFALLQRRIPFPCQWWQVREHFEMLWQKWVFFGSINYASSSVEICPSHKILKFCVGCPVAQSCVHRWHLPHIYTTRNPRLPAHWCLHCCYRLSPLDFVVCVPRLSRLLTFGSRKKKAMPALHTHSVASGCTLTQLFFLIFLKITKEKHNMRLLLLFLTVCPNPNPNPELFLSNPTL